MVKHVGKKGDTLVEVTLAVGIFSMVAISIVSVINGSTSSAQTSLEATLTREEVDAQAEALRFIQASASAGESDGPYARLWSTITSQAISADETGSYLSGYPPTTCSDLYNGSALDKAFVINTHALGGFPSEKKPELSDSAINEAIGKVYIPSDSSSSLFQEAATYPHLVYTDDSDSEEAGNLIEEGGKEKKYLKNVDGIYVIAVKDEEVDIVGKGRASAFYDFYIRTCWYGAGERKASTISTVIRLYDPAVTRQPSSN